jgi:hypothetical protein
MKLTVTASFLCDGIGMLPAIFFILCERESFLQIGSKWYEVKHQQVQYIGDATSKCIRDILACPVDILFSASIFTNFLAWCLLLV